LAIGNSRGIIVLWDVAAQQQVKQFTGHGRDVTSLSFSPDGSLLASGCGDETMKLWDVGSGRLLATLSCSQRVLAVAFSPDGKTVAVGEVATGLFTIEPGKARLWDVQHRRQSAFLMGHKDGAECLAFSPDGSTLATGDRAGTVRFWSVR